MAGGTTEIHKDDEYLATGTHKGEDGAASLFDPGKDLRSCGVLAGLAIYNVTQSTNGLVTASTEDTVTDDTNTWDNGDTYEVYKTAVKGSIISSQWTDLSRGWKSDRQKLEAGWMPEDIDLDDKGRKKVFGPGQPEKTRG